MKTKAWAIHVCGYVVGFVFGFLILAANQSGGFALVTLFSGVFWLLPSGIYVVRRQTRQSPSRGFLACISGIIASAVPYCLIRVITP